MSSRTDCASRLEPARLIEQQVRFASDDPAFAGLMPMRWSFEGDAGATLVTVRADDVPDGIAPPDHEAGLLDSLRNLAGFAEATR